MSSKGEMIMKEDNKKKKISKDNFIEFLMSSSKEELNDYILSKGKPPKLVNLVTMVKNNK